MQWVIDSIHDFKFYLDTHGNTLSIESQNGAIVLQKSIEGENLIWLGKKLPSSTCSSTEDCRSVTGNMFLLSVIHSGLACKNRREIIQWLKRYFAEYSLGIYSIEQDISPHVLYLLNNSFREYFKYKVINRHGTVVKGTFSLEEVEQRMRELNPNFRLSENRLSYYFDVFQHIRSLNASTYIECNFLDTLLPGILEVVREKSDIDYTDNERHLLCGAFFSHKGYNFYDASSPHLSQHCIVNLWPKLQLTRHHESYYDALDFLEQREKIFQNYYAQGYAYCKLPVFGLTWLIIAIQYYLSMLRNLFLFRIISPTVFCEDFNEGYYAAAMKMEEDAHNEHSLLLTADAEAEGNRLVFGCPLSPS